MTVTHRKRQHQPDEILGMCRSPTPPLLPAKFLCGGITDALFCYVIKLLTSLDFKFIVIPAELT